MTESAFFQDLAILMTIAGTVAIVFSRFGWPKVIGYILAGVLMSENTWGGGFLADAQSTRTIGQLGVVFLMFGMGLSFSPREMKKIRAVALPTAVLDTVVMVWLGYTVGMRLFGWSPAQSLFLGVAICDSATTLLAKVIGEMGWESRPFARYVLGTSVCEDIICVGAIAVATGFASGGAMSPMAFLSSIGGLGAFFLTVLVIGFIFIPRLLKSVSKRNDDEALLLALLGCCFFISFFAYKFDYSLALGAFLVGIIGGSSDVRDRLGRLTDPLKSMFSAVFFVSIGLLVNPSSLMHQLPEILLISALIIVGKAFNVTLASVLTGVDVKTAVQNGMGLAQVGEFAFMVAILYAGIAGDADNPMFTIAVGASLLTTLLNPSLIRLSEPIGSFVETRMPKRVNTVLQAYHAWIEKFRASENTPTFILIRAAAIKLIIYAVLMASISFLLTILLPRFDYSRFSVFFETYDQVFFFFAANLFAVALLPLILSAARSLGDEIAAFLLEEVRAKSWMKPMFQTVRFFIVLAVLGLFFIEWSMIGIAVLPSEGWLTFALVLLMLSIAALGWRYFLRAGRRATQRFAEALTAEERREGLKQMMTVSVPEGVIHRFTLSASSPAIGGTVVTLNIRAKTGASIVSVFRNGQIARNIGPEWEFQVGDTLVALGESAQIAALKDLLGVVS